MPLLDLMRRAPGAEPALEALAGEPGVHVVGGAVRDALLGRVPRELDLVVEGDAAAVARRAARRLGGHVVAHERFGTATVRAPAASFDVVSARTESYERPGALPDVRPGASIEEDLRRRDFAVNAIALRLADGEEIAFPGAREDLAAGRLRVLHPRSFEDDPTRLHREPHCVVQVVGLREHAVGTLGRATTSTEITRLMTENYRRSGERVTAPEGSVVDPVCGMVVELATATFTLDHAGTTYAFCAPSCRKVFAEDHAIPA